MFFSESETILGRIHDHLTAWRTGRPSAELLAAMRGEFHALKNGAAAAGFDDISALSHSVENLLAQSGDVVAADVASADVDSDDADSDDVPADDTDSDDAPADDVALLNLLEEVHDGLVADLGFVPAASREHVQSLNSLVALLLSGEAQTESAKPPPPVVSVSTFNDGLPQLRDIARAAAVQGGRQVVVSLSGGDVEVERRVLESMMAPFEHLIRGSVKHGIESAEQRAASGKTAVGRISISVAQRDAELVIEYSDDGRGLDGEKLAARAVQTGMTYNAGEVGEAHFLQIITQPDTTETANSGGGLEGVCRAVCEFGGLLAMKSEKTKGIRFQIQLPAAPGGYRERMLLVAVGKYRFAIPAYTIERVMRIQKEEVVTHAERMYVSVGGRQIPIVNLAEQLGEQAERAEPDTSREQPTALLVLIRLGDRIAAFEVDGFHDVIPVILRPPGAQLASIRGVVGVGVLADSSMAVVLDPGAFIERGLLEHHGLTRFPLGDFGLGQGVVDGGEHPASTPAEQVPAEQVPAAGSVAESAAKSAAEKTMRVVVLETTPGPPAPLPPLVIPAGRVAAIVDAVELQPSGREHQWICGEFHWRGFRVPVINAAAAFGAARETDSETGETDDETGGETVVEQTQPGGYSVILWSLKGERADGFFALTSAGPPRAIEIDARPAAAPSATGEQPNNVLGYVALDGGIGIIPDLENLARGIFHDR